MEEATEICKLRLFLKLAAQIESARHIEPLPDIDFNIRAGNTLVGFATYAEAEESVSRKFDFDNTMERIKSKAQEVERSFASFRSMQTNMNIAHEDMAAMKAQVRLQLSELNAILDGYLAAEYGISHNDIKDEHDYQRRFAAWRQTHQPFHWFVEFYRIIQEKGGFDVIIGNPPYVEYSKVRKDYTVLGYETESCGNLYAYMMERSVQLQIPHGRFGMIVPHSSFCTDRMEPLMKVYLNICNHLWISTYSIRLAKLFIGVDQRLAIILARFGEEAISLYATQYHHWREEARPALFEFMEYENVTDIQFSNSIPKIYSSIESTIWNRLAQSKELRTNFAHSGTEVYFHNAPRYWIRAMTFAPYFWNERGGEQQSSHVKTLTLRNEIDAEVAIAALNSSLFYWWFLLLSNCRDLTMREIEHFPLGLDTMNEDHKYALTAISERLMEDYRKHAFRKEAYYKATGKVVYDEFYPKYSKPIIDEIDRLLAQHYGFTDEELDFIINYDIKYRMGRGSDDEEEEE